MAKEDLFLITVPLLVSLICTTLAPGVYDLLRVNTL